jgi:TonB-dependent SusC/RagA subfamily outer membrane receptor
MLRGAAAFVLWTASGGPAVSQVPRGSVVGRVTDDRGSPLATACVHLEEDSTIRACVDARGAYLLQDVPVGASVLVIEAPGFIAEHREVDVPTSALAIIEVELYPSMFDLEGVTVTSERRMEHGASVAIVERRTLESPDEIARVLRDAVAGLRAASGGGQVGAGSGVRIRGPTSVTQGNAPLVYLDGIRLATSPVPGPAGTNQTVSVLSTINPADVARIEVLRGAAATTAYGMEASSGVILIVTRRGGRWWHHPVSDP